MSDFEPPCYSAAIDYIDRGLAVIPLRQGEKLPATAHGLNDWTDNPQQAALWWGQGEFKDKGDPTCGVAIVCGQCSHGLVVIDVDVHKVDGLATLKEWETVHGVLPETWTVTTGSGGRHLYYRTNRTIKPHVNGKMGIDVRGESSYVMAPPTVHPDTGNVTEWSISPDDVELADADANVYELIDAIAGGAESANEWQKFESKTVVREGEGRNDYLYRYGCRQRTLKHSESETEALIRNANATICKPPLGESELRTLINQVNKQPTGTTAEKEGHASKSPATDDGLPDFRGGRNGQTILHNKLGDAVIQKYHACKLDGAPAVFTGRRWEMGKNAIERVVLELANDAKKNDRNEVYSYIMLKCPNRSSANSFDGRYYVQFRNCTIDLSDPEGFTEVEPTPNMFIIGTLPIDFDLEKAKQKNYADDFLESIACSDRGVMNVLLEIIGAAMCSKILVTQSPFLIGRAGGEDGKASNGKSTFLNMLRVLLGSENVSSLELQEMGQRFQSVALMGMLANIGDDLPGDILDGRTLANFKKNVTGDTISTDVKNADRIEFKPTATFIFSMNTVPRFSTLTAGELRRMAFVPFRAHFTPNVPGFDPHVAEKLAKPDVLNRIAYLGMYAAKKLIMAKRNTFSHINGMDAEIEAIRMENDSVRYWVHMNDITAEWLHDKESTNVYLVYLDWCKEAGIQRPVKQQTFTRKICEGAVKTVPGAVLFTKKNSIGGKKAWRYVYSEVAKTQK